MDMHRRHRGAWLPALLLALMLFMTGALAEEAAAPLAEAVPEAADVFSLGGDEDAPVEDAPLAEVAGPDEYEGESMPAGEANTESDASQYVAADRYLKVTSSGSAELYIGDTLSLTFTRGAFTSLTSSNTRVMGEVSSDSASGTAVFRAESAGKATLKAKIGRKTVSVKVTVSDPYVATDISLPGGARKLNIDETLTLIPELVPATARDAVSWSSSKPRVAGVENGVVTPLDEGSTVITAKTAGGRKATVKVTVVNPYKPTSIAFEPRKLTQNLGDVVTLTPVIQPEIYRTTLTWKSSKPKVAEVTDGVVTCKAEGSATITVKTANGKRATLSLKVNDPYKPVGVAFPEKTETVNVGEELTLNPVLSPDSARTTFTWTTSKSKVATVKDGVVTGKSEGTATITVRTANGRKATVSVVVKDPYKPDTVTLTAETSAVYLGQTLTLTPVLTPDTAVTTYRWSTSKSRVATVKDGVVTGKKEGQAVITVKTANGRKATFTVLVTDPSKPLKVSLTEAASMEVGDSISLSAEVSPDTADKTLEWESSNKRVALVENGVVTGVGDGTANITATTVNGLKAVCKVTVVGDTDYRALLVGNDNFYNLDGANTGWSRGSYNAKAVDRMKTMLEGVRGPEGARYDITTRIDLTQAMLKSAIAETFADADEDDVSLFYISSHGQLGSGRLVMAALTERTSEYMSVATLRDCLLAVPGKVIVIMDTCGSGASIYLAKGAGGATSDPVAQQLADFDAGIISAFASADPGVYENVPAPAAERDSGDGIVAKTGELRVSNKFYVLCSAAYYEESYAYVNGSFFTDWVSNGVGKSGSMPADTQYAGNKNGLVDLHELYSYVSGVGDNRAFKVGGKTHYQHVQVYPADTRFEMFG